MAKIYYVGAQLSKHDSKWLGSDKLLHVTLIYSRAWFPYKPQVDKYPLVIVPPFIEDYFGLVRVIRFNDYGLERRHNEFIAAGATWDYEGFKSHISIPHQKDLMDKLEFTKFMVLTHEYYMTWDEKE